MLKADKRMEELLFQLKEEAYEIGGQYNGPSIWSEIKQHLEDKI